MYFFFLASFEPYLVSSLVHRVFEDLKTIWTKLQTKYGSDDAGKKKYIVGKWLQFQIIDDKPIIE